MTLSEYEIWYRPRFRRTSSALTATAFIISDLIAVMLSFGWGFFCVRIYYFVYPELGHINFKSFVTYWSYLPAFILIFQITNLYPGISLAPSEEVKRFYLGSLFAYGGIIMSRTIEHMIWDSINTAFSISFIFSTIILLVFRSITHWILCKTKLGGIPAVIYGSGTTGKLVADCLKGSIRSGYKPVLILDDKAGGEDDYKEIPVIHDTSLGPEIVKRFNIKMAIIAMPELNPQQLKTLLNSSVSAFRYNILIPNFHNISNIWMSVRDFNGVLGFETSSKLKLKRNLSVKRFFDLFILFTAGIMILPFLLLIAMIIKLNSSGPILYKQKRLGKNRKYFYAYKFRSMVIDAEEKLANLFELHPELKQEWDTNRKLQNDPRVTSFGRFLRKTSFDEFPQLINVLRGEMSLVGPRPIVDDEIDKYGDDFDRIFSVNPGLTGLWQVSGRSDTNYNQRIAYDLYYLQSWSIWLDLWILFKTIGVVIRGKGAY